MIDSPVLDSFSAIKRMSSAPARPNVKPKRAAATETCTFPEYEFPARLFVGSILLRPGMIEVTVRIELKPFCRSETDMQE